ncbi:hypothetical protein OPQ81_008732 [Rhizoctonia solani]|nr:hypothetical protein OPQ81_008732 [Rhizoctonia solani]
MERAQEKGSLIITVISFAPARHFKSYADKTFNFTRVFSGLRYLDRIDNALVHTTLYGLPQNISPRILRASRLLDDEEIY